MPTPNIVLTRSLVFDGATALAQVSQPFPMVVLGSATLSAWIYPTILTGRAMIFARSDAGTAGGFEFRANNGSGTLPGLFAAYYYDVVNYPSALPLNAWSHVAVAVDPQAGATLYLDGDRMGAAPGITGLGYSATPLYLGYGAGGGSYFSGDIADPRVYSRALEPWEVALLAQGVEVDAAGLLARYAGDGTTATAADSSPFGNGLTLAGVTYSASLPTFAAAAATARYAGTTAGAGADGHYAATAGDVVPSYAAGTTLSGGVLDIPLAGGVPHRLTITPAGGSPILRVTDAASGIVLDARPASGTMAYDAVGHVRVAPATAVAFDPAPAGIRAVASTTMITLPEVVTVDIVPALGGLPATPTVTASSPAGGTFSPWTLTAPSTFTFSPGYALIPSSQISGTAALGFAATGANTQSVTLQVSQPLARIQSATVLHTGRMISIKMETADGSTAPWASDARGYPILSGSLPTLSVNGGAPVQLANPFAPNQQDYVTFPLPAPARLVQVADDADVVGTGGSTTGWAAVAGTWNAFGDPNWLYKDNARYSSDANASASWTFTGLAPGKFHLWATWDVDANGTPQAVYTVHDGPATGPVLATFTADQRQLPYGFLEGRLNWSPMGATPVAITGTTLTVVVSNGAGSGNLVADAIRLQDAPDVLTIGPSDVVTLSAPHAWATCVSGPAGAEVDKPVINNAGRPTAILPPFSATPKTMKVGYNVYFPDLSSAATMYKNRRKSAAYWQQASGRSDGQQGTDANYNLTSLGYNRNGDGTYNCSPSSLLIATGRGDGIQPVGMPMIKTGVWSIYYSYGGTTGSMGMSTWDPGVSITPVGSATLVDAPTNTWRAQFDVQFDNPLQASPNLQITWSGTTPTDVPGPNVEVYEPGVPRETPDNKFNPVFLDAMAGAGALRFMDSFGTNGSPFVNRADFPDPNLPRIGYGIQYAVIQAEIASIEPVDTTSADADNAAKYYGTNTCVIKVRFENPHGMTSGQILQVSGFTGTMGGLLDTDGGNPNGVTHFPMTGTASYGRITGDMAFVLDTTTLIIAVSSVGVNATGINTLTQVWPSPGPGAWQGFVRTGSGIPLEDAIQACNLVGADFWFNVPHAATDACISAVAADIARLLHPGLRVILEYSNETWNNFPQGEYCACMGRYHTATDDPSLGGDGRTFHARRLGQAIALFEAAFTAASRPLTDMVRTLATQGGYAAYATASAASYAANPANVLGRRIQLDAVAPAPYFSNFPFIGSYSPDGDWTRANALYDLLDAEQLLDLFEVHVAYGRYEVANTDNLHYMGVYGYTSSLLYAYEGGPDSPKVYGSYDRVELCEQVIRHPRFRPIYLGFLQLMQDTGMSLFVRYSSFLENGITTGTNWADYPWPGIKPGIGDGSDGLFDNRVNPWDDNNVVGVTAGAWKAWAALSGTTPTPTPTPTRVTLDGPASGLVGQPSASFTATLDAASPAGGVAVTESDGGHGGTFAPSPLVIAAGTAAGTFTYTPASAGSFPVSVASAGLAVVGSPLAYAATAPTPTPTPTTTPTLATLSGPTTGTAGTPATFTATLDHAAPAGGVTVTESDGGAGGTFTPSPLVIAAGNTAGTFTYSRPTAGSSPLAIASAGLATAGSPLSFAAAPVPAGAAHVTSFADPANNVSTVVGTAGYAAGSGALPLAAGTAPAAPAPGHWYRVTVVQKAYATVAAAPASTYTIYRATGVSGSSLTGLSAIEGTTDRSYAAGDVVEVRVTAGTIGDTQAAVNAIETGATLTNAGSLRGVPMAPAAPGNYQLLAYSAAAAAWAPSAAQASPGGALRVARDPAAFGPTAALVAGADGTGGGGAGIAFARAAAGKAPSTGLGGFDDGTYRYLDIGGGGWGSADLSAVMIWTQAGTADAPDLALPRLYVDQGGQVTINPPGRASLDYGAALAVRPLTTAGHALSLRGNPAQAGDLVQHQDPAGNPLSGVDAACRHYLARSNGAPTGTPAVGTVVLDPAAPKLWVHVGGGTWKGVNLT